MKKTPRVLVLSLFLCDTAHQYILPAQRIFFLTKWSSFPQFVSYKKGKHQFLGHLGNFCSSSEINGTRWSPICRNQPLQQSHQKSKKTYNDWSIVNIVSILFSKHFILSVLLSLAVTGVTKNRSIFSREDFTRKSNHFNNYNAD